MKRLIASLSVASLVVGMGAHTVAATAPKPKASNAKKSAPPGKRETAAQRAARLKLSAPADEYFGKQKMSFIGINNTLHDEAIRSGDYTVDADVVHKVGLAEEALNDWQRKYPKDPQLARTLYLMGKTYAKIWTADGQSKAATYYLELDHQFPKTYFGKLLHGQLAKGFTEHVLAEALACPAPLPTATPTPQPLHRGQTPSPSPTPTDTPSPSPTPVPTPTPPRDSRIHLTLVPQPCYTPTPSPSPTPTQSPVPLTTGAPSPIPLPSGQISPVPSSAPTAAPSPAATKRPYR